jgi:hypothetical protein
MRTLGYVMAITVAAAGAALGMTAVMSHLKRTRVMAAPRGDSPPNAMTDERRHIWM